MSHKYEYDLYYNIYLDSSSGFKSLLAFCLRGGYNGTLRGDLFPKPIAVVGIIPRSISDARFPNPLAVDNNDDLNPLRTTFVL